MENQTKRKVGLACAGGVVQGAIYEIGALCALQEAIDGLDFAALDVYVGVSSGALISSCLANGISPHTLSRAIVSDSDAELNIKPEVFFEPAFREIGSRLAKVPQTIYRSLRRYLSSPLDISPLGILAGLAPLVPAGFFSNAPLQKYLENVFTDAERSDDFRDLNSVLRVIAVDLDSAEIVCFGDASTKHVPISRAVQASTALPGLYAPIEIDGISYIDGVARRTVHASVALNEGADLLFCINPIVPVNTHLDAEMDDREAREEHLSEHGLPAVLSQTFRTLVFSRMRAGMRNYQHSHPDADLILIEPMFDDYDVFFSNIFSFSNRQAMCEHAYQQTRAYLSTHAGELTERLRKHGLGLRMDVLNDPLRSLYGMASKAPCSASAVAKEAGEVLDRLEGLLKKVRETG